ncbi:AMP-binding protein [Aliiroseovarius crassostreae]|uniref:AMP-binding protein n=1 Tax=Aliiroseovarius crassostreae TaxID=154981 RepID=UPI003C7B37AD
MKDFADAVARHPERVAIVDGSGKETTYEELKTRAVGFARAWQARGVAQGDRVLLAMALNADLYASLAALWSLGATVVLPEPAMGLAGLRHAAKVTDVSAFCSSGPYGLLKYILPELWSLRHLRPHGTDGAPLDIPPPNEADIALISFTSGTTGAPKAIPRSHGFLTAQHHAIAPLLYSDVPERDLVTFPVFVLINIASGQTSVLPNWKMSRLAKLQAAQLEQWMTRQNTSRALLPPSLCEKLTTIRTPAPFHTVFTGGGPVFPDLLNRLKSAKPDLRIVCVYGSTEAEPIAHLDSDEIELEDQAKMTSGNGLLVGHPVDDLLVRIVEDEIQVAGAHVNSGYLDPKHDTENKIHDGAVVWHRTGDAGYFDDQGRLWLLGRMGSEVCVNGARMFPFSIEVAARGWQGVKQCALTTRNDAICLVIEGDDRHLGEWRQKAGQLSIHDVQIVSKIPMDSRHASKIDRNALKKMMRS